MGIFDRGIRGNVQSPFNSLGAADTIGYVNPRLPQAFGGNVQLAIDYLLDGMYPNYKGTVPTKADLPVTATQNDYYIVNDDGDGKSAGYVYSVLEGMTSWIKRYDVDYSAEGILADAITKTSYMYPAKYGATDRDKDGVPITGLFAGQRIYGGDQAGQNLTLNANAADGQGYIQVENSVRPTVNAALNLGSLAYKFLEGFFDQAISVGTAILSPGKLTDTSGSFQIAADLLVAGKLTAGETLVDSTLHLKTGAVFDTSGAIDFHANNLSTTGTLTTGSGSKLGNITVTDGKFDTAGTSFDFSGKDFVNVGNFSTAKVTTNELDVGDIVVSGSTVKTKTTNLNLEGTSEVHVNSPLVASASVTAAGALSALSVQATNELRAGTAAKISTNTTNARFESLTGDLQLLPFANISVFANVLPSTTGTRDLGSTALKFKSLFLTNGLSDGTNAVSIATLTSLRDINTNALPGMSLFYNGTEWLPSNPDTEIVHNTLSGLTDGDAGHTQFVMLTGRAGGQTIQGGTAAGQNLSLDSTSNATKGLVLASSILAPTTDQATDLGTSSRQWKDLYTSGLAKGLRFDQYNGPANYPPNSGAKIGRVIFDTSTNQVAVDNGTTWSKVGQQKFVGDLTFDGTATTVTADVSAAISDARTAMWQLCDNTNGFERVYTKMTFTQTVVTITTSPALPAGSYRLIGFN